jgi:hypothetical protein
MPIAEFLDGRNFDPETQRIMGLAFELARQSSRGDFSDQTIAERIIALATPGERDPERLCDLALQALRGRQADERPLFDVSTSTPAQRPSIPSGD